jgi:hypothetical protein
MAAPDTSRWVDALSDAVLQGLAGEAVFHRGEGYARDGSVREPEMSPLEDDESIALEATVRGTDRYEVRIAIDRHDQLHGRCDCPHAGDGFFCKHQVALSLVLRGVLLGQPPSDGDLASTESPASKRAKTQARKATDLQAFLQAQAPEALSARLWDWAQGDRTLMADLKAWAAQSQAGNDPTALQTAITELLRDRRDFLDWRESAEYARRTEKLLDWLRPWLQKNPAVCLDLCDHTLRRLYKVLEHADDSGGELGDLVGEVMALYADAVHAVQPPASWLTRWFDLMAADPFGLWREMEVLAQAGAAAQTAYAAKASEEWQRWVQAHPEGPKAPAGRRSLTGAHAPIDWERNRLRDRYLRALRLQDDPRALLAAMTGSAASGHEWVEAVVLCETQAWMREAMQWATHAHKLFPDNSQVEEVLLRAYERDGWDDEALAIRRRQLQQQPSDQRYLACLKAAERAGRDRAAYRQELMAWAAEREMQMVLLPPERVGFPKRPSRERLVSQRVSWCLAEGCWQEALDLVQPPNRCEPNTLYRLTQALPQAQQAEAVWLLQRVFDTWMLGAKSPYRKELALVQEIIGHMAPEQAHEWIDALRQTHKARRAFLAGLP